MPDDHAWELPDGQMSRQSAARRRMDRPGRSRSWVRDPPCLSGTIHDAIEVFGVHFAAPDRAAVDALCAKAEALQDSTDWEATTAELRRLQGEWKAIGAVRKNKSEAVWQLSFVSFLGNLKLFLLSISGALIFTILLVSGNTISMAVRERTAPT